MESKFSLGGCIKYGESNMKNYTAPEMEIIALSEIESDGGMTGVITSDVNDNNGSE